MSFIDNAILNRMVQMQNESQQNLELMRAQGEFELANYGEVPQETLDLLNYYNARTLILNEVFNDIFQSNERSS